MSVSEALDAAATVAGAAAEDGYRLRGYLSYAFRDKTQIRGEMPVEKVEEICAAQCPRFTP